MSATNWTSRLLVLCASSALLLPLVGSAQSLSNVLDAEKQRTKLAQQSQQKIDTIVDDTRKKEESYKRLLKEIEGLNIYNTLLQRQIDGQTVRMEQLSKAIDDVGVISRQIVPAMTRMIESLEVFVELDVPFLMEERQQRVAKLETLLTDPTVNDAEKFRKVTEAYQIENDYGRTIEAYKGTVPINGNEQEVDFLRIGRVSLAYQSVGGAHTGAWDVGTGGWVELEASEFKNQIADGLRVARKQVAPDLLIVPVPAAAEE